MMYPAIKANLLSNLSTLLHGSIHVLPGQDACIFVQKHLAKQYRGFQFTVLGQWKEL